MLKGRIVLMVISSLITVGLFVACSTGQIQKNKTSIQETIPVEGKKVEGGELSQNQISKQPDENHKDIDTSEKVVLSNSNKEIDSNLLIQIENNSQYAIWDGSKGNVDSKIDVDINNDGKLETVVIGRDHPNGTRVVVSTGEIGYNLFANDGKYFEAAFDDSGELKEGYYIQTSFFDLDKDGQKEVLLAIGNKMIDLGVGIYKYNGNIKNNGFVQLGYIEGQSEIKVLKDGEIHVPYGSQGLFSSYKVVGGKVVKQF